MVFACCPWVLNGTDVGQILPVCKPSARPCDPVYLVYCIALFLPLQLFATPSVLPAVCQCVCLVCLSVCLSVHLFFDLCVNCSICLQDPVDASPAVLVKRYDITQQKDLELKLSIQQQELQRCRPALPDSSMTCNPVCSYTTAVLLLPLCLPPPPHTHTRSSPPPPPCPGPILLSRLLTPAVF